MTPHETAASIVAKPAGWTRRRKLAVAIVALIVLGAAALSAFWYFRSCGDCGRGPILCPDPCTLPHFSWIDPPPAAPRMAEGVIG